MKTYKMYKKGEFITSGTCTELAKAILVREGKSASKYDVDKVRRTLQNNYKAMGYRIRIVESEGTFELASVRGRYTAKQKRERAEYEKGCFDPQKDLGKGIMAWYNK